MNNIKIECKTCHKSYTKKTLEKYRGLYCKSCFYDILIKENNDYKKLNKRDDYKDKLLKDQYKENDDYKNKLFIYQKINKANQGQP